MKSSKRNGKNSRWLIILVCIAVTAGLGLMGPAMAMWGDSLYVVEDVNTGNIDPVFSYSNGYKVSGVGGSISTSFAADPKILVVNISDAWHHSKWRSDFTITNMGTVPVRIEIPTITVDKVKYTILFWSWWEDALIVNCSLVNETVLDPGQSIDENITIEMNTYKYGPFEFNLDFDCVQWNGDFWQDTLYIDGTVYGN